MELDNPSHTPHSTQYSNNDYTPSEHAFEPTPQPRRLDHLFTTTATHSNRAVRKVHFGSSRNEYSNDFHRPVVPRHHPSTGSKCGFMPRVKHWQDMDDLSPDSRSLFEDIEEAQRGQKIIDRENGHPSTSSISFVSKVFPRYSIGNSSVNGHHQSPLYTPTTGYPVVKRTLQYSQARSDLRNAQQPDSAKFSTKPSNLFHSVRQPSNVPRSATMEQYVEEESDAMDRTENNSRFQEESPPIWNAEFEATPNVGGETPVCVSRSRELQGKRLFSTHEKPSNQEEHMSQIVPPPPPPLDEFDGTETPQFQSIPARHFIPSSAANFTRMSGSPLLVSPMKALSTSSPSRFGMRSGARREPIQSRLWGESQETEGSVNRYNVNKRSLQFDTPCEKPNQSPSLNETTAATLHFSDDEGEQSAEQPNESIVTEEQETIEINDDEKSVIDLADSEREDESEMMDESERLARQLMMEEETALMERIQQEQMLIIEQMRRERNDSHGSESDDLAMALQIASQEQEMETTEANDGEDFDPDTMSYDQLLELGERIGDVGKERWRKHGREIVAALPVVIFVAERTEFQNSITKINANLSADFVYDDPKCVVCQYSYEVGEELKILPCSHGFHAECIDGWLLENKTCVTCKRSIDPSDVETKA